MPFVVSHIHDTRYTFGNKLSVPGLLPKNTRHFKHFALAQENPQKYLIANLDL